MRFTLAYPITQHGYDPRLIGPTGMAQVVRAAESAGFSAVAFTEHPAPSAKWLAAGGHESLDPLTALAFCAAAGSRIRLMTYLLVLPYRNPLLAAKQIATVDRLSGGRLTLIVGSGYLRSEFAALGVDFDRRGALFDEAIDVLRTVWSGAEYRHEGADFTALGVASRPTPVQLPHPPLWFGGNSRKARQRAATTGSGWAPMLVDPMVTTTARTAALTSPAELAVAVDELRELATRPLDVQVEWAAASDLSAGPEKARDAVGQLADAGANWVVVSPPAGDLNATIDAVQEYGELVIR